MEIKSNIEVRFSDTDLMGIVYHGNYFNYFDIGRTELLEKLGLSYDEMIERKIMMPVLNVECKYIKSITYGDKIELFTSIDKVKGVRIYFKYKILLNKELMIEGKTSHAFVDNDMKPINMKKEHKDIWDSLKENQSE